ncbi:MAG: YfiR family protein [Bacteroidota bacterium]
MHQLKTIRHHIQLRTFIRAGALCCLLLVCSSFRPQPARDAEYRLKAAFLYNFTQYFEWEEPVKDVVVGVLGSSPITDPLEQIALAKAGGNKRIIVKHFNTIKDISYCHILFISQNAYVPLDEVLSRASKGTLTVTEKAGCGAQGAGINFIIVNNKLKFESNLKAINAAGLKASSQLLKLAIIVG